MTRLRHFVVALALFAGVGVFFSVPASGDPSPPVQVAMNQVESLGVPRGYEFDPAIDYLPFEYATCVQLMGYPDLPAPAGWQIQPDAAASMPTIVKDANGEPVSFTFTIRSGLGFSPPSTEQVTPESFVVAIERFEKLQANGYQTLLDSIQGAADYRNGSASSISGLTVSGDQLTVTLATPDQALPAKLALPLFCAVPADTPLSVQTAPIPSAGPYYVNPASVTRDAAGALTGFSLLRNPNYGGTRPATLPELDYSVWPADDPNGSFGSDALAGAQASPPTTDWVDNLLSPAQRPSLDASYGPSSPAADAGEQQYYESGNVGTQFLSINTTRPGLSDARVRQAINWAVDRPTFAGFFAGDPTDQITPIEFPGFTDVSIYPSQEIAQAQGLMQQAGYGPDNHLPVTLYVNTGNHARALLASELQTELAQIWIDVTVQQKPIGQLLQFVADPANLASWDLFAIGWLPDYPDGSDILGPLLDLRQAGNADFGRWAPAGNDYSRFDYAYALDPGSSRDAAWANLDANLMTTDAPLVPLAGVKLADFFSTRVGCQLYQPIFGIDPNRLCERVPIAAGGTYSTAPASATAPIQTTITSPNAGSVAVTTGATSQDVSGYDLLGSEVSIEAPTASTTAPLTLVFDLDASLLAAAGATPDTVAVLRNGVALPDCTGSNVPCVSSRTALANGGAEITVLTDHASTWDFGVRDTTPPTLSSVALSANPVAPGTAVTLSVDASSDAVAAEFFIDHDNGAGLNLPLEGGAGSFTTPPFGSTLAVGAHTLGIRVRDRAHNWSPVQTVYLVVSNDPTGSVTAAGSLAPDNSAIAFQAGYSGAAAPTPDGRLTFASRSFVLTSRSLEWLLADTGSAQLQGTGTIAGSTGTYRFRVAATTAGHVELRVWPASADPDASPPLYQASGDLRGGHVTLTG
jgi:peptide/nickel transport system substrate-binding protein